MQESKNSIVIFIYIAIFSLIVPTIFWFSSRQKDTASSDQDQVTYSNNNQSSVEQSEQLLIAQRTSMGEQILITAGLTPNKKVAALAFSRGNYAEAATKYNFSLQSQPNDPEALIYLNNAKAALNENAVTIAIGVPIGGNLNVSQEMLRGVAQAQQEINQKGGINGKLLQVKIVNDDNDTKIAEAVAQELVQDESVLAVIGHNASRVSLAAAPIYQKGGLVMITPTSAADDLPDVGDYIFRSTPSTRTLAEVLAEYAVKSARKTKIAICHDSKAEASVSFKDDFIWSVYRRGAKISDVECDFSAPDFNPATIPSAMVSNGADALLLAPSVFQLNKAIDIAKNNNGRLSLLANHSMNTYAVLNEGRNYVNGMVVSVPWHPVADSQNSFIQDNFKLWGGAVNWRTAMTYDATQTLIKALESASSRRQIQEIIASPRFSAQGATAKIDFLPSGDRNIESTLIQVLPGEQSQTGYDFVAYEP